MRAGPDPVSSPRVHVREPYRAYRDRIVDLHRSFGRRGITIHSGRNLIKVMTMTNPGCEPIEVAVKAFQVPARPRGFVYAHLRRSKALRSMLYARRLRELGIATPDPVACIEYHAAGCLRHGYYVCRYWPHEHDLTALLYEGASFGPGTEALLEQLARFTFVQHEKGVLHLDYNPGNVLARSRGRNFDFALVDLNRLRFVRPGREARIAALIRLTNVAEYLKVIGRWYAGFYGADPEDFCRRLEARHLRFTAGRRRKKAIKSVLGR